MSLNVKVKPHIHNRFDIFKENAETGVKEQVGYAENIVLDAMWSRLCGGSSYFTHIHYGTGTGTLSAARTSLFSYLGNGSAGTVETVRAIPTSYWRRSITLGLTTANGNTLTEVGIAYSTGSTNLVTHAQIRDMNGNPTGIVKTDVDIITIYATVYITLVNDHPSIKLLHPNSNGLLSYLLGGSFPSAVFSAGMFAEDPLEMMDEEWPTGLVSPTVGSSGTGSWSADTANKKRKTSTMRFETTVSGHIKELAFSNIARLVLPDVSIYSGLELSDVPIGTGDGLTDTFILPSANINTTSIDAKVDGSSATHTYSEAEKLSLVRSYSSANIFYNASGTMRCMSIGSGVIVQELSNNLWVDVQTLPEITPLDFSRDGTIVAGKYDGKAKVYKLTGETYSLYDTSTFYVPPHDAQIIIDADNLVILTCYIVSAFYAYDCSGPAPVLHQQTSLGTSSSASGDHTLSYSGNYICFSLYKDPYFSVFSKVDGYWVRLSITAPQGSAGYPGLQGSFSYDDSYLILSSVRTTAIQLYKFGNGTYTRVHSFTPYTGALTNYKLSFIPNTYYVVAFDPNGGAFHLKVAGDQLVYANSNEFEVHGAFIDTQIYTRGDFIKNGSFFIPVKLMTQITFDTPPADGAVITADYTVNGIHKTDQRVIDVSGEIQFGEPT